MTEAGRRSGESMQFIDPVHEVESLHGIGFESTDISKTHLDSILIRDNRKLIRKTRVLVIGNWILSALLLIALAGQIYWTVTNQSKIHAAPQLQLLLQNGRRVNDHAYKFDLTVRNSGSRYADGASIKLLIPEDLMVAMDGKMSRPLEDGMKYSKLEQRFTDHILKGKETVLAPMVFKFKEPKPFEEVGFIFTSPDLEDQRGKFIIKDPEYWSSEPQGTDALVEIGGPDLWKGESL